jgi:hypothetical protein
MTSFGCVLSSDDEQSRSPFVWGVIGALSREVDIPILPFYLHTKVSTAPEFREVCPYGVTTGCTART